MIVSPFEVIFTACYMLLHYINTCDLSKGEEVEKDGTKEDEGQARQRTPSFITPVSETVGWEVGDDEETKWGITDTTDIRKAGSQRETKQEGRTDKKLNGENDIAKRDEQWQAIQRVREHVRRFVA